MLGDLVVYADEEWMWDSGVRELVICNVFYTHSFGRERTI